jgi:hypothetical protein
MTTKILKKILIVLTTVTLFSFDMPNGWQKAGDDPESYDMGIDKGAGQDGKNAATIKSIKKTKGFGTLMQSCLADKYLGKRIKMTGYVKSLDVKGWAGLWLRIDATKYYGKVLGFDNMADRPIKKTTDWKKYEIIMDVPSNAYNLAYGSLLVGQGQVWFSNINFEIVDDTVSLTNNDCNVCSKILNEPTNLSLEK